MGRKANNCYERVVAKLCVESGTCQCQLCSRPSYPDFRRDNSFVQGSALSGFGSAKDNSNSIVILSEFWLDTSIALAGYHRFVSRKSLSSLKCTQIYASQLSSESCDTIPRHDFPICTSPRDGARSGQHAYRFMLHVLAVPVLFLQAKGQIGAWQGSLSWPEPMRATRVRAGTNMRRRCY